MARVRRGRSVLVNEGPARGAEQTGRGLSRCSWLTEALAERSAGAVPYRAPVRGFARAFPLGLALCSETVALAMRSEVAGIRVRRAKLSAALSPGREWSNAGVLPGVPSETVCQLVDPGDGRLLWTKASRACRIGVIRRRCSLGVCPEAARTTSGGEAESPAMFKAGGVCGCRGAQPRGRGGRDDRCGAR
jgi:hypothetical protein